MTSKRGARVLHTRAPETSAAANAEPSCGTTAPASRGGRAARGEPEAPLLLLRCVQCQGLFHLCRSCYRGQNTCQGSCRQQRRVQRQRKARRTHRHSEEGRLDHRDQERGRRARQRQQRRAAAARVGDLGRPLGACFGSVADQPPQPGARTEPVGTGPRRTADAPDAPPVPSAPSCPPGSPRLGVLPRCSRCGRSSRYVVHLPGGRLRRPEPRGGSP
jgi:hypothetical protein